MAFTKIVSPGIDTTGSYTVQELNTVGVMTAGTVQVGAATTVHTTGIDLGSGNITSHNINSTGIITATSFVGPVTGNITGDITATSGTFSGNVSIGGTLTYEDVTNVDSVGVITARDGLNVTGGRVLIGTTTEGESGADDLTIATSSTTGITIRSGTSNAGNIYFSDGTSGAAEYRGQVSYLHNEDSLVFGTDGAERLRVDSEGKTTIQGSGASNNPFEIFTLKNTETSAAGQSIQINLETNRNSQQGVSKIKSIANDNGGTAILELNSSQYRIKNQANTSTYATIDSSGLIGIGTVSPSGPIHAHVASGTQRSYLEASAAHSFLRLKSGSTSYNSGIEFFSGASNIANVNGLGAGGLQFEVNGSEKLRIKSNGYVGIGTDNPDGKLAVTGNGYNQINIASNNTANTNKLGGVTSQNYVGDRWSIIQTYSPSGSNQIYYGSADGSYRGATNHYFYVNSSPTATTGHTEALRITSSGNIGINDTAPSQKLNVGGNIMLEGGDQFLYLTNVGTGNAGIYVRGNTASSFLRSHSTGMFTWEVTGSEKMRLDSSGRLGLGAAQPGDYDGEADNFVVKSASHTGITIASSGSNQRCNLYFSDGTSGTERYRGAFTYNHNDDSMMVRTAATERLSIRSNGDLILGPYDAPGSYTTPANNVPYSIKVAPYGWANGSEIAAISMGNHSGATGNDDGEIVFKTAKDVHSSNTGLVERLRIDSNGDAIFYGNPSIDATDLYYTNTYSTNGWSTSNWYTVVPHSLTSNSTYLVVLVWDFGGSHGSPYYVATQQLYSTVNGTNGNGSENELTPMCSTHTGGTGARIRCRVLAQNSGSPAMQVNMNYTMGNTSYLKVKVWKMTFLNRS